MTDYSSGLAALERRLHALQPRRDVELAPYTTFKIGGPADLFCEPASADDLALAVSSARELGVP
jgi:UDP-N-acetylmuramate dehydrogenase